MHAAYTATGNVVVTLAAAEALAWIAGPAELEMAPNPGLELFDALVATGIRIEASAITITGNQWAFALGDLGLAAAWRAGIAKSKDKDQIRWGLVARDTPLLATDPLLARIAANAGTAANGTALIDVSTVFAKALTEPT